MESIKYRSSKWAGSTFASGSVIPSLPRLHNAHSRGNKNIVNFWQFNWKQVKENWEKQREKRRGRKLNWPVENDSIDLRIMWQIFMGQQTGKRANGARGRGSTGLRGYALTLGLSRVRRRRRRRPPAES